MSGEPIVGEALALSPVEVAPDHDVRAVLRITPFRRLWLALALSSFGDWLGLLATASLAGTLAGDSYASASYAVAAVFFFRLAPAVLLGPIAGVVADRLNRKFTLVVGDLARFVLFLSIPLIGTLEWLFVATVLIECFALFWLPAKDATVPNLVPRNRLEAANQISLIATYGSAFFAAAAFSGVSLLNGILDNSLTGLQANPVDLALYVNAVTFLVAALTIANLRIPPQRVDERVRQQSMMRTIVEGWRFIGTTPLVRGVVIGMLGAFAAAGFVIGLATVFVVDLGAGDPGFGVLFGAVFLGMAGGMWSGPRLLRGFSRRRLFGLSIVVAGLFLVAIALIPNMVMATFLTLGLGAAGGIAWVSGYTLLGLEVDDELRGRTFAFLQSAARVVLILVLPVGPVLAGLVGSHTFTFTEHFALTYSGAAFVFLIAGVLAMGIGVVAYRQMDDRPGASLRADLVAALGAIASGGEVDEDRAEHPFSGTFVVIEGGDGAGKSTQARLLAEWLRGDQGHEVLLTREPGATPLGGRLRALLLDPAQSIDARTEALLFAADRAHHVESMIRPALERGAVVVSDRYVDSSIAYQGAGRALEAETVARLSRWATRALVPDLTVLIDVPEDLGDRRRGADANRGGDDRLESESAEFHGRVRARFLELARREPHRYLVLSADSSIEELHRRITARVRELLPISPRRRAELMKRLDAEEAARQRRAEAEAQILRLDAELRAQRHDEERARLEKQQAARAEVERQLIAEITAGAPEEMAPEEVAPAEVAPAEVAPEEVTAREVVALEVVVPEVVAPEVVAPEVVPPAVPAVPTSRSVRAVRAVRARRSAHAPAEPESQASQAPSEPQAPPAPQAPKAPKQRLRVEPQETVQIPLGEIGPPEDALELGDLLFEELGRPDDEEAQQEPNPSPRQGPDPRPGAGPDSGARGSSS